MLTPMNALLSIALIGAVSFSGSPAGTQSLRNEPVTPTTPSGAGSVIAAINTPLIFRLQEAVEADTGSWVESLTKRRFRCGCRSMAIDVYSVEPRPSKLSTSPALLVSESYLKCQAINVGVIEPRVLATDYPPGHFGAFEYAGLLVSDWLEISEEASLRRLFALLIEVVGESTTANNDEGGLLELDEAFSLADYRKDYDFRPELVLEFVGASPLIVELDLTKQRLLIQVNDRWDVLVLDPWSATALGALIVTERNNRQSPDRTIANRGPGKGRAQFIPGTH